MRNIALAGLCSRDICSALNFPSSWLSTPLLVPVVENGNERLPLGKKRRRQTVGRAFDNRAQAALEEYTLVARGRGGDRDRHRLERAIPLELDIVLDLEPRRLEAAIRLLPAAQHLLLEHRAPCRGIVRGRSLRKTKGR